MIVFSDRIKQKRFNNGVRPRIRKHSQEYRFLATLQYFYSDRFKSFIVDEIPDLQDRDNSVGIDVTIASSEDDMEAASLFSSLRGKTKEEAERIRGIIEHLHYSIIDRPFKILDAPLLTEKDEKRYFKDAVVKKLEKLKSYREKFNKVGLAIIILDGPTTETEKQLVSYLKEFEKDCFKDHYDFYYILCKRFLLYYDTLNNIVEKKIISTTESRCLSIIGRMTAEHELSMSSVEWTGRDN